MAVDPADDHVFVNRGDRVVELDSSWNPVGTPTGVGTLGESVGVAAADGSLAITNKKNTNVVTYGPAVTPSDPHVDNPVVIDSLGDGSSRFTGDFQVSTSGDDAVFTSILPLTSYENEDHREVYRYHVPTAALDCASCKPTQEPSTADATLASDGLSLSDDGRVFFNSYDSLVDRDLNGRKDAYEWVDGEGTELISTGAGRSTRACWE